MATHSSFFFFFASLVAQLVKNPPAMWETWFQCLGWEDPLEKGKVPTPGLWPGGFHGLYSPSGHRESGTTKRLSLTHSLTLRVPIMADEIMHLVPFL